MNKYEKLGLGGIPVVEDLNRAHEKINGALNPAMVAINAVKVSREKMFANSHVGRRNAALEAMILPAIKLAHYTESPHIPNPLMESAVTIAMKYSAKFNEIEFQSAALKGMFQSPVATLKAHKQFFIRQRELSQLLNKSYFINNGLSYPSWLEVTETEKETPVSLLEVLSADKLIDDHIETDPSVIESELSELTKIFQDENSTFRTELKEVHKAQKEILQKISEHAKLHDEQREIENNDKNKDLDDPMSYWNKYVLEDLEDKFPNRFGLSRQQLFICIHLLNYSLLYMLGKSLELPLEQLYLLLNLSVKQEE